MLLHASIVAIWTPALTEGLLKYVQTLLNRDCYHDSRAHMRMFASHGLSFHAINLLCCCHTTVSSKHSVKVITRPSRNVAVFCTDCLQWTAELAQLPAFFV